MKNIYITLGIVFALVVGGLIGYAIHAPSAGSFGAVSSAGTSNNVTAWSSVTLNSTNALGTSTSILNTGASDRAVIGSYVTCTSMGNVLTYGTGAGLTSTGWTLTAATTTTSGSGLLGNTNYIVNETLATSSGILYQASTTEGVVTYTSRLWPTGTYLTFNLNATSTASCSVGIEYMPL